MLVPLNKPKKITIHQQTPIKQEVLIYFSYSS